MNVLQSLKSLSGYPIPLATIQDVADEVGISVDAETTQELRGSKEFKRAKARVYLYLSKAPNVSQGGITYSFRTKTADVSGMRQRASLTR